MQPAVATGTAVAPAQGVTGLRLPVATGTCGLPAHLTSGQDVIKNREAFQEAIDRELKHMRQKRFVREGDRIGAD